jgi:hypothetical protein
MAEEATSESPNAYTCYDAPLVKKLTFCDLLYKSVEKSNGCFNISFGKEVVPAFPPVAGLDFVLRSMVLMLGTR